MTSVSGAGYQSKQQGTFDPLHQSHGPAPALAERADNGPDDLAKEMERQVRRTEFTTPADWTQRHMVTPSSDQLGFIYMACEVHKKQ